jgi:hypothetical protein
LLATRCEAPKRAPSIWRPIGLRLVNASVRLMWAGEKVGKTKA